MNTQEADLNWHPFSQNAYEFKSPGEIRGFFDHNPILNRLVFVLQILKKELFYTGSIFSI